MKKTLIIFTNTDTLRKKTRPESKLIGFMKNNFSNVNNIEKIEIGNSFEIYLFSDKHSEISKLVQCFQKNSITPDFMALHAGEQGKEIEKYRESFPKAQVDSFHHTPDDNDFYKDILSKILSKNLTDKDIEKFFKPQLNLALNILHQIYNGEQLSNIEGLKKYEGIKEYEALVKLMGDGTFNYDDKHITALKDFRDEILQQTLANS